MSEALLGANYRKTMEDVKEHDKEFKSVSIEFVSIGKLWKGKPIDVESPDGETVHIESKVPNGRYIGWDLNKGHPTILDDGIKNWRIHRKLKPYYATIIECLCRVDDGPFKKYKTYGGFFSTKEDAEKFHGGALVCILPEPIMLPEDIMEKENGENRSNNGNS